MADTSRPVFDSDKLAESFADYGTTLRGYVRYRLTRNYLEPFLKKTPLRVLDVGGGNGGDAAWMASLSHNVVMLEPSHEQRKYAERRFNFLLTEAERSRIRLIAGSIADLAPSEKDFDVVLSHGVAMYQDKPALFIKQSASRLKPGGLISLCEKGYYGAQARAIREQQYGVLELLGKNQRFINHLEQNVQTFKPEELESMLNKADTEVLEWYGIRLITDELYASVSSMNDKTVQKIITAEMEQGQHPAIRGQGQLLQFVARKL